MSSNQNLKYAGAAVAGAAICYVACKIGRMFCSSKEKSANDNSSYKMIYFNARGRAELSRLLFNVAGVPFEDARYPFDPVTRKRVEWEADKDKYTFKQVPVLEVDGKQLPQSHAIERFLARRFDLLGDSDFEAALIDAVCEQFVDIKDAYQKAKKDNDVKTYFTTELPRQFAMLENLVKNGGGEWFVGKRMSLADLAFFNLVPYWDDQESVQAALVDCPRLRAIRSKVEQNEAVANWVNTRPKTSI
jgi:glutathione S-transferase